eukprot:COSAG05_NODE_15262_length_374_cov_0.494545_1_plen_43_part_10
MAFMERRDSAPTMGAISHYSCRQQVEGATAAERGVGSLGTRS